MLIGIFKLVFRVDRLVIVNSSGTKSIVVVLMSVDATVHTFRPMLLAHRGKRLYAPSQFSQKGGTHCRMSRMHSIS